MPMPKFPGHDKQRLEKIDHARSVREHQAQETFGKMDTYQPGRVLGQGSFGKVYEAMNMATGEMVAIKRIELKAGNDARAKQIMDAADAEITMMRILRHPNVVSVQGCWIEHDPERPAIMIVMQLVPGRSIADLIKTIGPFHELVVRRFTKQLLQALEYCHSLRAVHRDIKGQNILMTTTGEVRLADFGSAKIREESIDKDAVSGTYSYTPLWVAPETLNARKYDEKVDIWALGCVVIEMASGKEPWDEMKFTNSYQAILHIGNSGEIPRIPSVLSEAGREFCRLCLTRDPDARPSARELLKHRFIVGDSAGADAGAELSNSTPASSEGLATKSLSAAQQMQKLTDLVDSRMETRTLDLAARDLASLDLNALRAASPVVPLRDVPGNKAKAGAKGVSPPPPPPHQDDDIPPPPPADAEGGPAHCAGAAARFPPPPPPADGNNYPYKGPASAEAMVPGSSVFTGPNPVAAGYDNAASNRFNVVYSFGTNGGGFDGPVRGGHGGGGGGGLSGSSGSDGSGAGSRVFHFSPSSDGDHSNSPSGNNSLNSSVVSFIDGYEALRLQPDAAAHAKATPHRR